MRLATFNLKHGAKFDGYRGRPEAVAQACASLQPDVLALQEVDCGTLRSGFADLAKVAAEACGMVPVYRKTLDFHVGTYGNALLVKEGIQIVEDPEVLSMKGGYRFKRRVRGHFVHGHVQEPRNAILATLDVGDQSLTVVSTHLSTEKGLRRRQLYDIVARVSGTAGAVAVMGDLNMNRHETQKILHGSLLHLPRSSPATFPAPEPKRAIDHIAVRELEITNMETRELPVSDHRALLADIAFL